MAVFTELSLGMAQHLGRLHSLPPIVRVVPVAAGSVNSNFFIDSHDSRWFVRVYEEQGVEGVAYEWALLSHLAEAALPVPRRVPGSEPGEARVGGKPAAVFDLVGGTESCQAGVTPARAEAVGALLAQAHLAAADFPWRRQGRFGLRDISVRLDTVEAVGDAALPLARLRAVLEEVDAPWPGHVPLGVIHGDLFRDNVRWDGDRIVALIDWESASDGVLVYDLAVTVLAWCYGADMSWDLARAMLRGYGAVRPVTDPEWAAFRKAALTAALRFTATRITDFTLRRGSGDFVFKDYRRFLARLEVVSALSPDDLARRLGA